MVFEWFMAGLNSIFDPIIYFFGPNKFLAVFVIGAVISFVTTLANKLLVDQDRLAFLQTEMKEFNQEMMEARKTNDTQALAKLQKKQMEFMSLQKEMMMMSFKPMIVTFVPILIVFWWMAQSQLNNIVLQLPSFAYYILLVPIWHIFYPLSPGLSGMVIEWLGWYFLAAFGFSFVFRKLMGLKSAGGM